MTLNEDPNTSSTASGGSTTSGGGGVASSVTNVAGALSALSSASGSMYVSICTILHSNYSRRRRRRRIAVDIVGGPSNLSNLSRWPFLCCCLSLQ